MAKRESGRSGGRIAGAWVVVLGVLVGAGLGAVPSPVVASIDPAGQRCFAVTGARGDAAIVNLTPVLASRAGDGQLISSDVKANPPLASNTNFQPGSVDPNVAVTPVGADGEVCYQNSVHASVDLVADHLGNISAGEYTPATSSGAPDRRVDTRTIAYSQEVCSVRTATGTCSSWAPTPPVVQAVQPAGRLCFDVKGDPGDAAIVNLTPVAASGAGDAQLISSDVKASPPLASNTNFQPGSVDPNVAVTRIGADGQVCFQNSVHATVHVIADHLGTISAAAYTPARTDGTPSRRVDTRINQGGGVIPPSGQLCFAVSGDPGDAAIVNLTPVSASGGGDGQLISSDVKASPPLASNTNFRPGSVDPNVAVTRIGADGQVCFQNSVHSSLHLVADHLGTIAAFAYTPATPTGAPDRKIDTRDDTPSIRPECANPVTTSFDTPTARTMFGLASRAYQVEPGVAVPGQRLHLIGTATVHFAAQMSCWELVAAMRGGHDALGAITDTEVIVARNVETQDIVVSFRGTELDFADIITDLGSARAPWRLPNGQIVSSAVHSGFATAYLAVRNQLLDVLDDAEQANVPGARVYFTGHSLGGALASLASIDLVDDLMDLGYSRDEVVTYTFGAPRSMSRAMASHHATFAPVSHAVANPRDPVPHLPSAIGTTNPYSHLRRMTLVHGQPGDTRVRLDAGDGRDYRGCVAMPVGDVGDHGRAEYHRRLESSRFLGAPTVRISISETTFLPVLPNTGGHFRLNWTSPIEAPCDRVGLFEDLGSSSTELRFTYTGADVGVQNQHTTNVGKADDHWVGYVNMFGRVISSREYVPATPTVSLRRAEKSFPFKDDIEFVWSVPDPGAHDLIVLYDRNPWTAGPGGYYRSIVGRVEAEASSQSPEETDVNVDDDPNKWWVAYIMIDDDGNQRILSVSRGVSG